jgi:hypothetical protein
VQISISAREIVCVESQFPTGNLSQCSGNVPSLLGSLQLCFEKQNMQWKKKVVELVN